LAARCLEKVLASLRNMPSTETTKGEVASLLKITLQVLMLFLPFLALSNDLCSRAFAIGLLGVCLCW
jgi:hypothetical protein